MKKNIALMALTGILTLASCGQNGGGDGADPVATIGAVTTPNPLTSAGGTVKVTGTVTDDVAVKSVVVTRGSTTLTCSVTGLTTKSANFSCDDTLVGNASTTDAVSYTYKVVGTDTADKTGSASTSVSVPKAGTTPASAFNVTITNPSTGDVVAPSTPITVKFNADADMKSATCSLDGTKVGDAVVNGKTGFCTVTPTNSGATVKNAVITVNAVSNATGNPTGAASVTVQVTGSTPTNTKPTVSVDDSQPGDLTKILDYGVQVPIKAFDMCGTYSPAYQLNGWMPITNLSGNSAPSYTVNADGAQIFVKGKVRFNISNASDASKVEAYYKTTQPNSANQKLDVMKDAKGYYVIFDTSYGAQVGSNDISHEGLPTTVIFRVDNTQVASITVYPDNMAPEAINPEVDAARRANAKGQIWVAGKIDVYSANKAIEDKPLGSDSKLNAGFENVCYYLVPEKNFGLIKDANGDNPKGLNDYANSIRTAGTAVNGTGLASAGAGHYYNAPFTTADATLGANGYVVSKKYITDGKYKVYSLVTDKLGNQRPSGTPFNITVDNSPPKLTNVKLGIADDSPLPFPATPGYVSDYAKISVTGTLAGSDIGDGVAGIGVDNRSAACAFNGINLLETGSWSGAPWASTWNPSSDGTGIFRYNGTRFDSNKWADGAYTLECSRYVKDLLDNANPDATIDPFKLTVDNVDPVIDITNPDMQGTLTAGQLYRPEAQVRDSLSGVRESYLFWDARWANQALRAQALSNSVVVAPRLGDPAYRGSTPLANPIEIMRATAGESSLGGIEWRAPSFADQTYGEYDPSQIVMRGLVIDKAGNATLRSKAYQYNAGGTTPVFNNTNLFNNSLINGVFNATSFPLTTAAKNYVMNGKNIITGVTSADTAPSANRVPLLSNGDVTLEVDTRTVNPSSGVLQVPAVYGRFNSIDWQAIRNYMVTPANDNNEMPFVGPVGTPGNYGALDGTKYGDLLSKVVPTYADNLTASNTGDPSYLAPNSSNHVTIQQRVEWMDMLSPWMTLQGVTNTPDVNSLYSLTNSLNNAWVGRTTWARGVDINTPSSRFPTNNCATDTYCTSFQTKFDQINAIFQTNEGNFVFTGRNLK